ncbi:MAG: DUF1580 domain-containing protein [Pirellulaceae bacterium]
MFEHVNRCDHASPIPLTEDILSLSEAATILPRRRGKKTNTCTLYRWTKRGLRGVVLESIQIGGTRCTSRQALERFFGELDMRSTQFHVKHTVVIRPKNQARTEQRLDELRI